MPVIPLYPNYPNCTSPDGVETVLYLQEPVVLNYSDIKQLILNDQSEPLTKRGFNEIIDKVKGYVIKLIYNDKVNDT